MKNNIIYTLGTSNNNPTDFLDLIKHHKIETIVDVRRFPKSKFEHFSKEHLVDWLTEEGIHYLYLGNDLGGFRKEGYLAYTSTLAYQRGIAYLEQIAQQGAMAIICAEKFPWKCHRRFIASTLGEKGWQVIHILDKDRVCTLKRSLGNDQ